jgi:release factor glutamine methyltransferase
MTIKQTLIDAITTLKKSGIPSQHLDGEILLAHALQKPKEFLYTHPEYQLTKKESDAFQQLFTRRLQHEPIAYIINKKEFYGYEFYVDKRVLIPRPETEMLVDSVKTQISKLKSQNHNLKLKTKRNKHLVIIDIGTGSGCIIISIIKELLKSKPNFSISKFLNFPKFIATDISADALEVTKINAKKHKVNKYIKFYQGDLLEPFLNSKLFTFNFSLCTFIITANLPYITHKQYLTLAPEIKKYEPKLALLTQKNDADYYYKKLDKQIEKLQKLTKVKVCKFYEKISLT